MLLMFYHSCQGEIQAKLYIIINILIYTIIDLNDFLNNLFYLIIFNYHFVFL